MTWQETAELKRKQIADSIPKEWVLKVVPSIEELPSIHKFVEEQLTPEEIKITNSTLLELSDEISKKTYTSLQITKAFAHRAVVVHQLVNNLIEIFFDRAFARAEELDAYFAKTGEKVGPLHGLPISLKDQINLEGIDSTIGYVSLVNKPKTKEEVSVIADILYDAGAVFYVKTTVPMAMMAPDTVSNLHGQTRNPYNRKLSPGGSSGGESSLIAAKGGIIGLSTDIGGSIRIPAAFNGVFALKPSSNRLPYAKLTNSNPNQTIVPSVVGPSATSLKDIDFFVKTILDAKPWLYDPKVPPIPWRKYDVPEKLTFGILFDNEYIKPHPPIQRALKLAKERLEAAGHEVVEWNPPIKAEEILPKLGAIFVADGLKDILSYCEKSGEPAIKQLMGDGEVTLKELNVTEYWELTGLKYSDQQKYDKYWLSTATLTTTGRPVDAWISPVWESTSYPAGEVKDYHCSYTEPCNYLDLPSVVVPVTYADKSIDKVEEGYNPKNTGDKETYELYDPELFDGMPVALQVITPRYEEERAVALGGILYDSTH